MAFEKGKREEFDDLRVTYKGTHHADISDENSKIVPFNESQVYHYNGRIYEPEDIPAQ